MKRTKQTNLLAVLLTITMMMTLMLPTLVLAEEFLANEELADYGTEGQTFSAVNHANISIAYTVICEPTEDTIGTVIVGKTGTGTGKDDLSMRAISEDTSGEVVIPDVVMYNDKAYSVTEIGYGAFRARNSVTKIVVPDTVTKIHDFAFSACQSLMEVEVPDSVTSLGKYVFANSNINTVTFPSNEAITAIPEGTFQNTKIKEIDIPAHITSVERYAFAYCKDLVHVSMPDHLSSIGNSAFYQAPMGGALVLNGPVDIEIKAFAQTSFESIEIEEVSQLGAWAFSNNTSLKEVILPDTVTTLPSGIFSNTGFVFYEIPSNITNLENQVFDKCNHLIAVYIPRSVQSIGIYAFREMESGSCIYLEDAAMSSLLISSGSSMNYTSAVSSIAVTNGGVFTENTEFNAGKLAVPVKKGYQFDGWYEDKSFAGNAVTVAESGKTYYAKWIERPISGQGTQEDPWDISDDEEIDTVTAYLQQNNEDTHHPTYTLVIQGSGRMKDLDVTGVNNEDTPQSEWKTDTRPWKDNIYQITKVVVEEGVIHVGKRSLKCAKNLEELVLPDSLETIGYQAFHYCSNLKTIDSFGSNLHTIMQSAFQGTAIESISIPGNIKTIEPYAFFGCSNLSSVKFNDGIEKIDNQAFAMTAVEKIEIPDSVLYIGKAAFYMCKNLDSVILPKGLSTISNQLFQFSSLKRIEISDTVTTIGENAFQNTELLAIFIPGAVTEIEKAAFIMNEASENLAIYVQREGQLDLLSAAEGTANYTPAKTILAVTNEGIFAENTVFEAGKFATPIKKGYKFDGWYGDELFTGEVATTPEVGKIYYAKWTEKVNQSISYAIDAVTRHVNDGEVINELMKSVIDGKITYDSSNPAVATVDETTGEVSIIGGGKTTITATAAETDTHNEAVAAYTLIVTEHEFPVGFYASDDSGHWQECIVCGEKTTPQAHTFEWITDKEATAADKGSQYEECSICGFRKKAVEIPSTGKPEDKDQWSKEETGAVQTEDSNDIWLWFVLLLASSIGISTLLVFFKKYNRHINQ